LKKKTRRFLFFAFTFLLLITSLFLVFYSSASVSASSVPPAVEWQKIYRFGEDGYVLLQTDDGGYAICGGGYSKSIKPTATLITIDSSGSMQWNKNLSSIFTSTLVLTSDGGYAASGVKGEVGTLYKLDSEGNSQWNQTYTGGADIPFGGSLAMIQTSDDGYALALNSNTGQVLFGRDANFIMLIKLDSSGNVQWAKNCNFTNDYSVSYSAASLIQTSDGGYAIAGYMFSGNINEADFCFIKTSPEGNVEWTKRFGGVDDDRANSVIQTSDGGYVLAGNTNSFGAGDSDAWLIKTDSTGNQLWTQTYGGTGWLTELNGVPLGFEIDGVRMGSTRGSNGSEGDVANCVIQTSDGGFAFTGQSGGFMWLVATDSSGKPLWNQTYSTYSREDIGVEASSLNTWGGNSLIETSDGALAIIGWAQMGGFAYLNGAYFLVKTEPFLSSTSPRSTPTASPSVFAFPATIIRADGDVDPSTVPIQRNGDAYTFTGNLNGPIVVERDNIVIDGAGHSLQGNGTAGELFIRKSQTGINLTDRTNITIRNLQICSYNDGIYLDNSTHVNISENNITQNDNGIFETASTFATISGNNIAQNDYGVFVTAKSSNNKISGNNIGASSSFGITLNYSDGNVIFDNNISSSGINLESGSNNLITGNLLYSDFYGIFMNGETGSIIAANNFTACSFGISSPGGASGNLFYMNDFNNTHTNEFKGNEKNSWDNGTVGNYWSDYLTRYPNSTEIDNSGIGDTPYAVIYGYIPDSLGPLFDSNTPNLNNVDHYPLLTPVSSASAAVLAQALVSAHSWSSTSTQSTSTDTILLASLALIAVVIVLVVVMVLRRRKKQT